MARKTKRVHKANPKHSKEKLTQPIDNIHRVITRLEGEIETLLQKILQKGERSRRELRKNLDDLYAWLKKGEWAALASDTRDEVEREVRRLAEDLFQSIKEVEGAFSSVPFGEIFQDARKNFTGLIEQLSANGWVQRAKSSLDHTKKEVLALLSIPTHDEVVKLERKIVSLEKRLSALSRKAA